MSVDHVSSRLFGTDGTEALGPGDLCPYYPTGLLLQSHPFLRVVVHLQSYTLTTMCRTCQDEGCDPSLGRIKLDSNMVGNTITAEGSLSHLGTVLERDNGGIEHTSWLAKCRDVSLKPYHFPPDDTPLKFQIPITCRLTGEGQR